MKLSLTPWLAPAKPYCLLLIWMWPLYRICRMHVISMDLQLFHNRWEVYWLRSTALCPNFRNSSQVWWMWEETTYGMIYFTQSRVFCVQNVRAAVQQVVFNCKRPARETLWGLVIWPHHLPSAELCSNQTRETTATLWFFISFEQ